MSHIGLKDPAQARTGQRARHLRRAPQVFCWSKVGVEAGQKLSEIFARKELERISGGGHFVWGIGNSLGKAPKVASEISGSSNLSIMFTPIRSPARDVDRAPPELWLWTGYFDHKGMMHELPLNSLVTSRGGSRKKAHYGLFCFSDTGISDTEKFFIDPSLACNVVSGKLVGSSQVNSVISYLGSLFYPNSELYYRVCGKAELMPAGCVKLARPVPVKGSMTALYEGAANASTANEWADNVLALRKLAEREANKGRLV